MTPPPKGLPRAADLVIAVLGLIAALLPVLMIGTQTSAAAGDSSAVTKTGTGRFSDATGLFTIKRVFDTVTGLTTGSFKWTISSRSMWPR